MRLRIPRPVLACFLLLGGALSADAVDAADWRFTLRFPKSVRQSEYSGRVYVIFSQARKEPRMGPSWFRPESFIAKDVKGWKPGTDVVLQSGDEQLLAFPKPLAEMNLDGYHAQAVVRFNPHERTLGTAPGNGYSAATTLNNAKPAVDFAVDSIVPERKFAETKWVKLLRVRSKRLSDFHKRDVYLQASVRLPAGYYDNPKRKYPTLFTIPGFGGTHRVGGTNAPVSEKNRQGVEFLRVQLDPSCPRGHHVFADSANNGPVGRALVDELIPAYEKEFRAVASPTARFVGGHSSGGWSSLWLQTTYPETFGGTWSTSPDPVDFRDFQQINLYREGENMYRDRDGKRRPLARVRGRVVLWYDDFAHMERVLGYGGQLHSFEAVFSQRGVDGEPVPLWDRDTGKVNTDVAKTWRKYDIRLNLERNWKTLEPKLRGKLHVHMGDEDTFYLEGATILLKESLDKLGAKDAVTIHPGKDHGNILTPALRDQIRKEMTDAFLKSHPGWGEE